MEWDDFKNKKKKKTKKQKDNGMGKNAPPKTTSF
jgi:hypothetical protein